MAESTQGSYAFNNLVNQEEELKRLLEQATILPDLELNILKKHGLGPGQSILDAACGPGAISCMIAQRIDNVSVIGADINPNLLTKARETAENLGLNIEFVQRDIYDLDYKDQFDFIFCRFLFQHLIEPLKALRSLMTALKPKGKLFILDIDDQWLSLFPDLPSFKYICSKALEHQARLGGDREVGRKLRSYLNMSGFSNVNLDVVAINSDQIGIEEFLRITTGFKSEALAHQGEPEGLKHLDTLWEAARNEDLFGIVGVFIVTGTKG